MSPSCINHCSVCPTEAAEKLIENHCKPKRGEERVETLLQSKLAHIVIDIHINKNRAISLFMSFDVVNVCFMNVICVFYEYML
jgi:hypothetical protein